MPQEISPIPPRQRSRRMYIMWGVALALLLTVGIFCWLVVVPYLQVRAALERCPPAMWPNLRTEARNLGSKRETARKLRIYLRFPDFLTPRRKFAVWMLSQCGRDGAAELMRLAVDPHEKYGGTAYGILGNAMVHPGIELLQARIKDGNPAMRALAADLVWYEKSPKVAPLLIEALDDADDTVRATAARSLGFMMAKGAMGPLLKVLEDPEPEVRKTAAGALGLLLDVRAVDPLLKVAATDANPGVRKAAANSVKTIREARRSVAGGKCD